MLPRVRPTNAEQGSNSSLQAQIVLVGLLLLLLAQ